MSEASAASSFRRRIARRRVGLWMSVALVALFVEAVFDVSPREHGGIGGTGLGLALVREIVESHQDRAAVSRREGEGSTFSFVVPAVTDELRPEKEGPLERAEEGSAG